MFVHLFKLCREDWERFNLDNGDRDRDRFFAGLISCPEHQMFTDCQGRDLTDPRLKLCGDKVLLLVQTTTFVIYNIYASSNFCPWECVLDSILIKKGT